MHITTEGIVLRQNKTASGRRMIVIFTKDHGRISAGSNLNERGKGRSALALRPFTYAEYELYKGRESYNVNGAGVIRSYYSIGEDLDRFLAASTVIRYLDKTLEEEQSKPALFRLTLDFLDVISKTDKNYETILCAYIAKTLPMHGIMPELRHCVNCGKEREAFRIRPAFSIENGGILCEDCVDKYKTNGVPLILVPEFDIVEVLQYLTRQPLSSFTKLALRPGISGSVRQFLDQYLEHYLGIRLETEELTI